MGSIYAKARLFICIGVCVIAYILVFAFTWSLWLGHAALLILIIAVFIDYYFLSQACRQIDAHRTVKDQLSLSDEQQINYSVTNDSSIDLNIEIIDELPHQLQQRDFLYNTVVASQNKYNRIFKIRPVIRGLYNFGKLYIYASTTSISLLQRRVTFDIGKDVSVYPSFIQMKKYDLQIFNKVATMTGIKKVRRIGKTDEFEHVKNYTQGDNIKSINWKATSRKSEIMINQFQDTRSQSVYCIIDKGRSMKMPFEEMSLLEYAINSTLVLSNIILKKYDRAGVITFNESLSTFLKSDNKKGQISRISQALYDEETSYKESNYRGLHFHLRKKLTRRTVLILFSNFENVYDMRRALPYLRQLNKLHLLVIVFFTNTELISESEKNVELISDIYGVTFAKKALIEKELITEELRAYGIQAILSTPKELSVNVINKYLEIKAKRML